MVYSSENGHQCKYSPGQMSINFVDLTNDVNHYTTPPPQLTIVLQQIISCLVFFVGLCYTFWVSDARFILSVSFCCPCQSEQLIGWIALSVNGPVFSRPHSYWYWAKWLVRCCCVCSLCCISPVLAAKVIKGCQVTIGSDQGTASAIENMGAKHINKTVSVSFMSV